MARHWDQAHFVAAEGFAAFANFACRRSVLELTGAFEGRLRSDGDREFCARARVAGFAIAYAPDAVVDHPPRTSPREVAGKAFRHGMGRADRALPAAAVAREAAARTGRFGADRLATAGARADGRTRTMVDVAGWALVGAPLLAGYAAGRARRFESGPRDAD